MTRKIPVFAKCLLSSVFSACVDFALFFLVEKIFAGAGQNASIVFATVISRVCSTAVNFFINKFYCFENCERGAGKIQAAKFFVLFAAKMAASAALVCVFAEIFKNAQAVMIKLIVDSFLFFVSYIVQKKFIF